MGVHTWTEGRTAGLMLALFLFGAVPSSAGQVPARDPADSLRAALAEAPDSARVRLLLRLSQALLSDRPAEAARAAREAGALAHQRGDSTGHARAHYDLAFARVLGGAFAEARAHLDTADASARGPGDLPLRAAVANLRARALASGGDLPAALNALLRTVALWERLDGRPGYDPSSHAAALVNLGHVHGNLGDLGAALARYQDALPLAEAAADASRAAAVVMSIGSIYQQRGERARAAGFYRRAIETHGRAGNRRGAALARANLAQIYGETGRYAAAVPLFREAVAEMDALGDRPLAAGVRAGYADALLDAGRAAEAHAVATRALEETRALGAPREQVRALEALAFASTALGRTGEAARHRARHGVLRDSVLGAERAAEGERIRGTFDAERREAEIVQLQTEQALQAATLDRQRLFTTVVALAFALALLVVGALVWGGRHRRRAAVLGERTRIAREIHDTLLQGFTAVTLQAQVATDQVEANPAAAKAALESALEQADRTLVEARQAIWDKRSPALDGQTLPEALGAAARRAVNGAEATARVTIEGTYEKLPDRVEADLLRIGTEAVTNAARHSGGSAVDVRLAYAAGRLLLEVRDNGCGFDLARSNGAPAGRWGLLGMRERAAGLGATLRVESAPEEGTAMLLALPYRAAQASATQEIGRKR